MSSANISSSLFTLFPGHLWTCGTAEPQHRPMHNSISDLPLPFTPALCSSLLIADFFPAKTFSPCHGYLVPSKAFGEGLCEDFFRNPSILYRFIQQLYPLSTKLQEKPALCFQHGAPHCPQPLHSSSCPFDFSVSLAALVRTPNLRALSLSTTSQEGLLLLINYEH